MAAYVAAASGVGLGGTGDDGVDALTAGLGAGADGAVGEGPGPPQDEATIIAATTEDLIARNRPRPGRWPSGAGMGRIVARVPGLPRWPEGPPRGPIGTRSQGTDVAFLTVCHLALERAGSSVVVGPNPQVPSSLPPTGGADWAGASGPPFSGPAGGEPGW